MIFLVHWPKLENSSCSSSFHKPRRGAQVTPVLCDSVARWQEVVPVAAALRNPVMQDRHWTKLQQELGVMLPVGPAFTLQTLFDLKVTCCSYRRLVSPVTAVRRAQSACNPGAMQIFLYEFIYRLEAAQEMHKYG